MKKLLSWSICALVLVISTLAQTPETFDIATFRSPVGWTKRTSEASLQFSTEDKAKGTYCLITLLTSVPGTGDAKKNFDAAWQTVVKTVVDPAAAPQMFPSANKEDWKAEGGFAPFEKDGEKGVAVLFTLTGYAKMVNILVLTNTTDHEPTITAFLESVSLKKPESAPRHPSVANNNNESIVGTWGISSSAQNNYAVNHGIAGTITRQYTFYANGTYQFVVKNFQYTMANLLFKKETGTYQLSGNSLTITPQKSYIQAWTKGTVIDSTSKPATTDKWGKLVSTQATKLEKVTYQISKQYFSGIQEWQLVMQASQPNDRDGPFTGSSSFPNSWIYGTPCEQCLIEQPR